jgi:hypothetical protein
MELLGDETEAFVDQIGVLRFLLLRTRFPRPLMERTPVVSLRGLSLFATHTMVCSGTLSYHIPT